MFVVKKQATFKEKVKIITPDDKGGMTYGYVNAEFRLLPQSRINDLFQDLAEEEGSTLADVLEELVEGVHGVGDENGNELSPQQAKAELLDYAPALSPLLDAYNDALGRGAGPRGKTSKRRRATG